MDEGHGDGPRSAGGTVRSVLGRPLGRSAVVLLFAVLTSSVFTVPPTGGFPTPGGSVGVDLGSGDARWPALAVDATGAFHVVHGDDSSGERGIYYARSDDGLLWISPRRIDTPGTAAFFPDLAVEREPVPIRGRLYATYQVGASVASDIWVTLSDGGAVWSPPQRLDLAPPGFIAQAPSVAASNTRAYVAWEDSRITANDLQVLVRVSADGGATWGPETQLSAGGTAYNQQSRVDAKGDSAAVVWREFTGTLHSIWAAISDDGGVTWRAGTVAAGPTVNDVLRDPAVFLDDLGVVHVAWEQRDATGSGQIYYARSGDGTSWSTPVRVDSFPLPGIVASAPSISGLAGTLWVAWHDNQRGDLDVNAAWSTDGVVWSPHVRVDDTSRNGNPADDVTNQGNAALRTGGYGVYVVWEDARTAAAADIYFGSIAVAPLVITEIRDEPASEASIEIFNMDRNAFPLAGVFAVAGSLFIDLSPLGSVPARSHVVVGGLTGADLEVPLALGTEGGVIELWRGVELLTRVGFGQGGVAPDALPGESVARFGGTLDYTTEWTRAQTSSFRARNAVPPPDISPSLLLNEVLFNPASPGERFLELYLRESTTLDLTGYRIVSDSVFTVSGGSVSPGSPYAFLFEGTDPTWFGPLDPDGDNVYLYDPAGRLLDMVGWSSAHALGTSISRIVAGSGGLRAFDDASAPPNGWSFDTVPSLSLVLLEADQRVFADIGTTVQFLLTATNLQAIPDFVNVESSAILTNWPVAFTWTDRTPLTDSAGDADLLPDLGLVGPAQAVSFLAEVTIPVEGTLGDGNVVTARASAASVPVAGDDALLGIDLYPHFDVTRTVSPPSVYLQGSGPPYNEVAQITIAVEGAGLPIVDEVPIDVVFQIDESGSMNWNDAQNLRTEAVKFFIDGMQVNDRGALIGFHDFAWVVANRPLTYADAMGKVVLKGDADTLACSPTCAGGTNIDAALQLGNDWLISYGDPAKPRVEILLTDGECTVPFPPCPNTNAILDQAIAESIVIYTIGLGAGVNEAFLRNIADRTGGRFYQASSPQDLRAIYEEIGLRINRTAGVDPDVYDNIPMIEDDAAPYLTILPNSFYDPATGMPRPPSFQQELGDRTRLQWNVSRIEINESWSVRYSVTSALAGVQTVALHPDSRVAYLRWDGSTVTQPIPQEILTVLVPPVPPTPPHITATTPADGVTDVDLNPLISAVFDQDMDPASVVWSISPPIVATVSWLGRVLTWDHGGLRECTHYTVEVLEAADLDGEALEPGPVPNPWGFDTVCPTYVRYTFTRSPELGEVLVNGTSYPVPASFIWREGTIHPIVAPALDPIGASRLVFGRWDDGGNRDRTIVVGSENRTFVAMYTWQHRVDLTFQGLRGDSAAGVRFTLWGLDSGASSWEQWSEFVDDGSSVDVDGIVPGVPGERFITEDVTGWTVVAPLEGVIRYHHQFTARVQTAGLEGHEVAVEYTSLVRPSSDATATNWSAWVDAASAVRVEGLVSIGDRERYRTLNEAEWTVAAPLDATVPYLHQYLVQVTLIGTDELHTVGSDWTIDRESREAGGLVDGLLEWADTGSMVRFDQKTSGRPPRYAQSSPEFLVDSAFNETLRYTALPVPPPPANWKPLLALAYVIGLLAVGAAGSRRSIDRYVPGKKAERKARKLAWKKLSVGEKFNELSLAGVEQKIHRDRRFTRALLMIPFAGAEAGIGVASYATGLLRIPEAGSWLPAGFWVNTVLLAGGVAASVAVWRRGYRMTEDALLRMAETREPDSDPTVRE